MSWGLFGNAQIRCSWIRYGIWLVACVCTLSTAYAGQTPQRTLKICVAADAPAIVRQAAQQVLAAVTTQPLLRIMARGRVPGKLTDSLQLAKEPDAARAYSHLVLVGLPTDPLIHAAWQREAKFNGHGCYIFGFGYLHGTIGYIESGRNPFLHAAAIKRTPFETELVTLTGDTPQAIVLAVHAFLHKELINGVVAAPGWTRSRPSLLERAPLAPDFVPPNLTPSHLGSATRIGWTQADQTEYRGVQAACNVEPQVIWLAKYHLPGTWSTSGSSHAIQQYLDGLDRRAYGDTLWLACFASRAQAVVALPRIALAAHLRQQGDRWIGHASSSSPAGKPSAMPLTLWQKGNWLYMSTLPQHAPPRTRR